MQCNAKEKLRCGIYILRKPQTINIKEKFLFVKGRTLKGKSSWERLFFSKHLTNDKIAQLKWKFIHLTKEIMFVYEYEMELDRILRYA